MYVCISIVLKYGFRIAVKNYFKQIVRHRRNNFIDKFINDLAALRNILSNVTRHEYVGCATVNGENKGQFQSRKVQGTKTKLSKQ